MEHISLPTGATLSDHDIALYVAEKDYIGVEFKSYPEKKGFNTLSQHTIKQALPFTKKGIRDQ